MARSYSFQLLIALDQLANTVFAGHADETLSSRAYRCQDKRRWRLARIIIDKIFFWQDDHCLNAYLSETRRTHLPASFAAYNDSNHSL